MRTLSSFILIMVLPLTVHAFEIGSAGASVGGSWMSQSHDYTAGAPSLNLVDGGLVGPAAGGFLRFQLRGSFSAGVEALYIQKGFESTSIVTNASGQNIGERTDRNTGHYLSIPLSAVYTIEGGRGAAYLFAGLSAEFLLAHDDFAVFEHATPVALGGQAGVGIDWNRYGLNVRYFTDITDSFDPEETFTLQSVRNYGFLALVTFSLMGGS